MDSLAGAVIAAAVAWASIVLAAVVRLPGDLLRRLRTVGAASLAGIGLAILGAPVPTWLPVAVLVGGGAAALLLPRGRPPHEEAPTLQPVPPS